MKKTFGIIGNPIKHSLSPVLHKYWFDKYSLDADYSIIEGTEKDLKKIIKIVHLEIRKKMNTFLEKNKNIKHLIKDRLFYWLSFNFLFNLIIANLIISDADPCIGALIAALS